MKPLSFRRTENKRRIDELAEKIKVNDVVFFVGAALSMTCGLPLAADFKLAVVETLAQSIKERGHQGLRERDEEWLRISSGRLEGRWWDIPLEVMFQFIVNSMGRRGLEPFSILDSHDNTYCHNHLFLAQAGQLYFDKIITTNQDRLIENACQSASISHYCVFSEKEIPYPLERNSAGLQIIKLHGTVEDLQSLVVTMDQAGSQLSPRKELVLSSCLEEKTVCFAGYGLGDYEIYSTIMNANTRDSYALLKPKKPNQDLGSYILENQRILEVLEKTSGTPIVYDIDAFFDELCATLLPLQHRGHASSLSAKRGRPGVEAIKEQIAWWPAKISTFEALHALGSIYHHMGFGDISRRAFRTALELGEAINKRQEVIALLGESMGYAREGDYGNAWRTAEEAKKVAVEINDRFLHAEALFHSGSALQQRAGGFSLRGLHRLRKAENIYSCIGGGAAEHGKASAMLSIVLTLRDLLPKVRALDWIRERMLLQLKKAYQLLSGPNGNAMRIIADFHCDLGQIDQAIRSVKEAELICKWHKDNVGLANTKRVEARICLWQANLPAAKKAYFCALRASRRTADQPGTIKALAGLASTNAAQGRKSRSALLYKLAIKQILDVGISNLNIRVLIKVVAGRISTSESWRSS